MIRQGNIQTKADASYLYMKLAENKTDETTARVFRKMSRIENDDLLVGVEEFVDNSESDFRRIVFK